MQQSSVGRVMELSPSVDFLQTFGSRALPVPILQVLPDHRHSSEWSSDPSPESKEEICAGLLCFSPSTGESCLLHIINGQRN